MVALLADYHPRGGREGMINRIELRQRRALPQIASNIRSIEIDSSIWLESMKLHQSFATSSVNWKRPVEIATVNEVSVFKRDGGRGGGSVLTTRRRGRDRSERVVS